MQKISLPIVFAILIAGFWISPDLQLIAAGIATFLFGMLMLEDGFKLFGGGFLERALERATSSIPKAFGIGILTTTLMQSSSLVSVITISFLSAGLIPLLAGVGIIFGANIGTTTGAWLVAGFGLKVNISTYAMPLLVFGVILVFQKPRYLRGTGYVLAGLGFLFLGIHYMKEGFETFKDQFDLSQYAITGMRGLVVYTIVGALATVVMQSSHAAMVLIITALSAAQISYDNALALAIGSNIGTTVTAIIGALPASYQGKRLALAHLIFNTVTAGIALAFIDDIGDAVNWVSAAIGIGAEDYALKLAAFHTVFNVLGAAIMLLPIHALIRLLESLIPAPLSDVSQPKYLGDMVEEFPAALAVALHKEVHHLYENAEELIAHGLNLRRQAIFNSRDLRVAVEASQTPLNVDLNARYESTVKSLYCAIVEFTTRVGSADMPQEVINRIYDLRDVAGRIVRAVKAVKHMRKNAAAFTQHPETVIGQLYNELRVEIAQILLEIRKLDLTDAKDRTSLWLEEERILVEYDLQSVNRKVELLLRERSITPTAATSFLNDSYYAYDAMRNLIEGARTYYLESEGAMAEVERILAMDEDELDEQSQARHESVIAEQPRLGNHRNGSIQGNRSKT